MASYLDANSQTIINAPPDTIASNSIFGSSVEIIISDGADVPNFSIGSVGTVVSNSFVNVTGGLTGNINLDAEGGHADISGGDLRSLRVRNGSSATITGGNIRTLSGAGNSSPVPPSVVVSGGQLHFFSLSSDSEIIGNDFKLNGVPYSGSTVNLQGGSLRQTFTGVLADGSPFISIGSLNGARLTEVPVAPSTPLINISTASEIKGLSSGQTLNILTGGSVQFPFIAVDATINLDGGKIFSSRIPGALQLSRSNLNILSGDVIPDVSIHAYSGSLLNLAGGTIDTQTSIYDGAVARIDGGVMIGKGFDVFEGGHVEIVSGTSRSVRLLEGATGRVTGGQLARNLEAQAGSDLEIVGGDFLLNGLPIVGGTITIDDSTDILTGTLSDGTSFIRSGFEGSNRIDLARLTEVNLPLKQISPITINDDSKTIQGLREGQTATIVDGGELPFYFDVVDAEFNTTGGLLGERITLARSTMNLAGGRFDGLSFTFGPGVKVLDDSVLNVTGGDRLPGLFAYNGGVINYFGSDDDGPLAIRAEDGGTVNIFGGEIGERSPSLGGGPAAFDNGIFNIYGSSFHLDGVPISELNSNGMFEISDRDVLLTGFLSDGTLLELDVSSVSFPAGSEVNVILVPEPLSACLLILYGCAYAAPRRNNLKLHD